MTADAVKTSIAAADEAFATAGLDGMIAHLAGAMREFDAAEQPCAAAMICVRLGQVMADLAGNLTAARAWFARAERLVADQPACVEQGWIAVAAMGCDVNDPDVLLERAELALQRARRFGDLNLETKALADAGLAHVQSGRIEQGMSMLDEAMALACGPADDSDVAARSVCSFYTACQFAMDFERASSWDSLLRHRGLVGPTPGGPLFLSSHCDSVQATLLMELGRWGEAEALLQRAIRDFEASMGPSWHPAIALADLRTRQGRLADAEALLLGKEQAPQALLPWARLQLERGDHHLAIATARRGLAVFGDDRLRVVDLLAVLVEALLAVGDVDGAEAACADLAGRLTDVDIPAYAARWTSARAAVLAARGDPAAAARLLERAVERTDGLPWRRAQLLADLVRMRVAAGDDVAADAAASDAERLVDGLDVVPPAVIATRTSRARLSTESVAVLVPGPRWWTAALGTESVRLPATKGLGYVAELVASPGVERHVFDLVDRVEGVGDTGEPDRRALGDAGPLLDATARTSYRRRIEGLRTEIEDALAAHAYTRAEALQDELDQLVGQLAGAFGLGGRSRAARSAVERARLNVTRAIRTALKRLDEALPGTGAALDRRVRTGLYCAYLPVPGDQIRWIVQSRVNGAVDD